MFTSRELQELIRFRFELISFSDLNQAFDSFRPRDISYISGRVGADECGTT